MDKKDNIDRIGMFIAYFMKANKHYTIEEIAKRSYIPIEELIPLMEKVYKILSPNYIIRLTNSKYKTPLARKDRHFNAIDIIEMIKNGKKKNYDKIAEEIHENLKTHGIPVNSKFSILTYIGVKFNNSEIISFISEDKETIAYQIKTNGKTTCLFNLSIKASEELEEIISRQLKKIKNIE